MIEKRRKTTVEERVQVCHLCHLVRFCQRHHLLQFRIHGECNNGFTLPLCGACHESLHIALAAIVKKKKRASQLWEALVEALGKDNTWIQAIENQVYETCELVVENEIKYFDY